MRRDTNVWNIFSLSEPPSEVTCVSGDQALLLLPPSVHHSSSPPISSDVKLLWCDCVTGFSFSLPPRWLIWPLGTAADNYCHGEIELLALPANGAAAWCLRVKCCNYLAKLPYNIFATPFPLSLLPLSVTKAGFFFFFFFLWRGKRQPLRRENFL